MKRNGTTEEFVSEGTQQVVSLIKSWIFDLIAVVIVIGMLVLELGALGHRSITIPELINVAIETVPFFLTSQLLSSNFYTKGVFAGKSSAKFVGISDTYTNVIEGFNGEQISSLPDFCVYYNQKALEKLQTSELKMRGISYEEYAIKRVMKDGTVLMPLKSLSKKELIEFYGKDHMEMVKCILSCNKMRVKGVNVNILLGNLNSNDMTNLGPSESQLSTSRSIWAAIGYLGSTFLLTLLAVKNISEWGWAGIILVIFKLAWITCSTYVRYFMGYQDITIKVCNHIARKTDILNEFASWYKTGIKTN